MCSIISNRKALSATRYCLKNETYSCIIILSLRLTFIKPPQGRGLLGDKDQPWKIVFEAKGPETPQSMPSRCPLEAL